MKKKLLIPLITAGVALFSAVGANAQDMNMYVNNQFVVRDMQTVGDFDMLPVLNIAGELGFNCSFDGNTIKLYNDAKSFTFTMGDASVYDQDGNWYGLDVVPQVINDQVRVPAKFFQDAMGMSYVWDSVTNTVFMGSESTYEWLINTWDYQQDKKQRIIRDTMNQRILSLYDPFYLDGLKVHINGEDNSNYYIHVFWHNPVTGNYNLWGELIIDKATGDIYDGSDNSLIQKF